MNSRHWYALQNDHGNSDKYETSNDSATFKTDQVTELCCFDRHALPKLKAKLRNSIGLSSYYSYIFHINYTYSMTGRYDHDDYFNIFSFFNLDPAPIVVFQIPHSRLHLHPSISPSWLIFNSKFQTLTVNICKLPMVVNDINDWMNKIFFGYRLLLITYCVSKNNIIVRAMSAHFNATNGDFNYKITKIPKWLTFK